jgi:TonB family protein
MVLYAQFLRQQGRIDEATGMEQQSTTIRIPASRSTSLATGVFRVGGGVAAPMLLSKVEPEYSEVARAAKYQGTVTLYVEVGPDGVAHNIKVLRSLGMGLDEKAIDAVGQWTFKPGTKDGNPVTVAASIEVNFRLL